MMKFSLLITLLSLASVSAYAQIENIIVETYYVSHELDATDTAGGYLPAGSKTYRIYVDLKPGAKLKKIYGDANHALKFSSTETFFNNKADGQTFAKDFSKNRYSENTVALDSWLTLGQTTKLSSKTYFGIPKAQDTNGSFIGGSNNDGGSAGIEGGLLRNDDTSHGIPLTTADGMDTMSVVPGSWGDSGFKDFISQEDSTIFGSVVLGSQFISYDAMLINSGVSGVIADSNQILVAQLTTLGDLSFELNLEVEEPNGDIVKYVANDSVLTGDEVVSGNLKYPPSCGCKDPKYLEYNAAYGCNNQSACQTLIVCGCADTLACNYNSSANLHIQDLCCYVGRCNDLDINLVCPDLSPNRLDTDFSFDLYPNPTQKYMTLKNDAEYFDEASQLYNIYDALGNHVMKNIKLTGASQQIDVSKLSPGLYLISLSTAEKIANKKFIKN